MLCKIYLYHVILYLLSNVNAYQYDVHLLNTTRYFYIKNTRKLLVFQEYFEVYT